jgi:hypothetical protein
MKSAVDAEQRTQPMTIFEIAVLSIFFNPDTYLPHLVALTTVFGIIIEPFCRQIAKQATAR